jgi:hypothetical protein
MISNLRGPKSSTNTQRIGKEKEEEKEPQSQTHWRMASRDHNSAVHQHTQAGRQKNERKKQLRNTSSDQAQHFIKQKNLQGSPIDYQAKDESSTTLNQKKRNYKKRLNSTPPQQQALWW